MTESLNNLAVVIEPKLNLGPDSREIGDLAVWSVTSAKPGKVYISIQICHN